VIGDGGTGTPAQVLARTTVFPLTSPELKCSNFNQHKRVLGTFGYRVLVGTLAVARAATASDPSTLHSN
jgi:hypothetical protein